MTLATLWRILAPEEPHQLYQQHAVRQYTQTLEFATLVNLMCFVVGGLQPRVRVAFQQLHERVTVVLKKCL